jgi:hypothetical protein
MNHSVKLLMLLLCIWTLPKPLLAEEQKVLFFQGTYEQLKAKAVEQKKPYVLYFYNSPTKYDSVTFQNKYVAMYGNKRYLFFKVKAFSLYSDYLVKKFEVGVYPQVCIVTPEGKLVERIIGYAPPEKVLELLRKHEKASGAPEAAVQVMARGATPELSLRLQLESTVVGVYNLEVRKYEVEEKTLGVQVGVFQEYDHLLRAANELGDNWHQNVMVAIVEIEGKRFYRLILAPFYTYEHALSYQRSLRENKGLYGIIVRLDAGFVPVLEEDKKKMLSIEATEQGK